MHQHLLAANIWKYKQGQGGAEMLKNVAEKQPVLVSTGAQDWLESSGQMEKTKDGYLVTATKHFASQSAIGDMLVTSAPYQDPEHGWQVLHFPVPFKSQGVKVLNNWFALGMRGTGSHSVKLERVFVPESAITVRRPQGEFHPVWNVVLTVAMPLIMSVYLGIAQKAAKMAIDNVRDRKNLKPYMPALVGAMHNELTSAELHVKDMIRIANNYDFKPVDQNGQDILTRKTNAADACIGVVEKAMEIAGGQGFFRSFDWRGSSEIFRVPSITRCRKRTNTSFQANSSCVIESQSGQRYSEPTRAFRSFGWCGALSGCFSEHLLGALRPLAAQIHVGVKGMIITILSSKATIQE
jgi:hypothetical protein